MSAKSLAGRVSIDELLKHGQRSVTNKPYVCTECGTRSVRSTNHYGSCYPRCVGLCMQPTTHVYDHKWALLLLANNGTLEIDQDGEKIIIEDGYESLVAYDKENKIVDIDTILDTSINKK